MTETKGNSLVSHPTWTRSDGCQPAMTETKGNSLVSHPTWTRSDGCQPAMTETKGNSLVSHPTRSDGFEAETKSNSLVFHPTRSDGRQPAGWRLRQRAPPAGECEKEDRGARSARRASLRHLSPAARLPWLRQQDPHALLRNGLHQTGFHRRQQTKG